MDRRRDDVARRFLTKLDDVFAKIGLYRRDAVPLEEVIDCDLFADHRLALGDVGDTFLFRQSDNIFVGGSVVGCPKDAGPIIQGVGFESFQ